VRTNLRAAALTALLLAVTPATAAAASIGFKHQKTIYGDDKEAPLRFPEGVACDDNGSIVIADSGNGRLLTFSWKDGALTGGAPLPVAQLAQPVRVQIDSRGNVLVLDRKARKIGRVDPKGAFGGWVEITGVSSVVPVSFRIGPSDQIHVLDVAGRRALVLDGAGKVAREIGLPSEGQFVDIAVDGAGNLYVLDAVGAVLWKAEAGARSFQPAGKPFKDRVAFPAYVAFAAGRIYVVDQNGSGIAVFGVDGSYLGRELTMGASEGTVYYPAQICLNERGDAFVADRQNHRVQVFAMPR